MTLFGWRLVRVAGDSMAPTLRDGDYVLARERERATVGSVALLRHPTFGSIIKRVKDRDDQGRYRVAGDSSLSTSSDALGPMDASTIQALVRWRISPSGLHPMREVASRLHPTRTT
ncbi:MAG: S24/S26 family peptidase [Acidobacteriota bacterium]